MCSCVSAFNPIALRKAKIVCNFGLSECIRVKMCGYDSMFFSIMFSSPVQKYRKLLLSA